MSRRPIQTVAITTFVILSTFIGAVALPMAVGTADASHEPKANYTFAPKDHSPGLDDGAAEHYAVGIEKDMTALHTIVVSSKEFDFSDCSAAKTTAFGIDRGNDDPNTQTDESLLNKYSSISFQSNKIIVKFNKEEGLGSSTVGLKTNDQIVAAGENCYDNPDKKGWYQVNGMLNGSTNDDSKTDYEISVKTHYIYVCDCENRQEAVNKLGPPPSESGDGGSGGSTSTSTPTASPTASSGGGSGGGSTSTSTATPTASSGGGNTTTTSTTAGTANGSTTGTANGSTTGTATAATSTTATGGSGATATGGGNPAGGANTTPTENSGPGFGLVAAFGALLASGAVALRRRD
jgi:hypothetical protein